MGRAVVTAAVLEWAAAGFMLGWVALPCELYHEFSDMLGRAVVVAVAAALFRLGWPS